MPKIPTYLAELPYRPAEGDVAAAGAPGRALAAFGETVGKVGDQIAEQVKKNQEAEQERQKQLVEKTKQAEAENQRADATAEYLDGLLASARHDVEDFESSTSYEAILARNPLRIDAIRVDAPSRIGDLGAQRQVVSDMQAFADIQRPILAGERAHQMSEHARAKLPGNLAVYAKAAIDARHPVEFDHLVELAEREIRGKAQAGFFTEEEADRFEQDFYGDLARRQAERAIADDPDEALSRLRDKDDFPLLAAADRARLTETAGRAALDRALSRETEWMARRRETLAGVTGYVEALRDGAPPDDARFTRDGLVELLGEREGAEQWDAIETARAAGKITTEVRWATPDELASRRAALAGDPAQSRSAADYEQAVARRDEQLHAKPADYVLANPHVATLHQAMRDAQEPSVSSPAMPAVVTDMLQAAGAGTPQPAADASEPRRAATQAYANATFAEQERLGLPEEQRRLLPETEAGDLAATLAAAEPAETERRLRGLAADWGADWPAVRKELVARGLPGEYRLLGDIGDDPVGRQAFVNVLAAQAADSGALRAEIGADADLIDRMLPLILEGQGLALDAALNATESTHLTSAVNTPAPAAQGASGRRGVIRKPPVVSKFPVKAEPLYDDDGEPVVVWSSADGEDNHVMIPEGASLNFFAEMGEADRNLGWIEKLTRLSKFLWRQPWDLQRPITELTDGFPSEQKFRTEFRDVSTIAIGVYAAAAEIPMETILGYQKTAARRSRFASNELISKDYAPLPERNVRNTELGYNLYKFGKIKAK